MRMPWGTWTLLDKAKKFLSEGDVDGAIETLHESIESGADSIEALYLLGNCYGKRSVWDDAIRFYGYVVEMDPNHKDAQVNLSIAKLRKKEGYSYVECWEMKDWEVLDGEWRFDDEEAFLGKAGHAILKHALSDCTVDIQLEHVKGSKATLGVGVAGRIGTGGKKRFRNGTCDLEGYTFNFHLGNKSYNLYKLKDGNFYRIHRDWEKWPVSPHFKEGRNWVRIVKASDEVRIEINGKFLTRFKDDQLADGSPYLYVGGKDQSVRFRRMRISGKPMP